MPIFNENEIRVLDKTLPIHRKLNTFRRLEDGINMTAVGEAPEDGNPHSRKDSNWVSAPKIQSVKGSIYIYNNDIGYIVPAAPSGLPLPTSVLDVNNDPVATHAIEDINGEDHTVWTFTEDIFVNITVRFALNNLSNSDRFFETTILINKQSGGWEVAELGAYRLITTNIYHDLYSLNIFGRYFETGDKYAISISGDIGSDHVLLDLDIPTVLGTDITGPAYQVQMINVPFDDPLAIISIRT